MYKLVESFEDLALYYFLLESVYGPRNYQLTPEKRLSEKFARYIVFDEEEQPIGTIGFKTYDGSDAHLEAEHAFAQEPEVIEANGGVVEIVNLALLDAKQLHGFLSHTLNVICHHIKENRLKIGLGLIDERLYMLLRRKRIDVQSVGQFRPYLGHNVIPFTIDLAKSYENRRQYTWFREFHETAHTTMK
jgi:hypothetical protein